MAWACMAANGMDSLLYIDDVTVDRSIRMNSVVYRATISNQIQPNTTKLIGWHFTVQIINDLKQTVKATQDFLKAKKFNISQ